MSTGSDPRCRGAAYRLLTDNGYFRYFRYLGVTLFTHRGYSSNYATKKAEGEGPYTLFFGHGGHKGYPLATAVVVANHDDPGKHCDLRRMW